MRYEARVKWETRNYAGYANPHQDTWEEETLKELQDDFWWKFCKNTGLHVINKYISGHITDKHTGRTWPVDLRGKREGNMEKFDIDNVKATRGGDFINPVPGGYVCRIERATDNPNKKYLELEIDIVEGEYKDFYAELNDRAGFWGLKLYRSYKDTAKGMFKGFLEDVGESNPGFAWDWDEKKLEGLRIGAVIGEEEYQTNDGQIKTRLKVTATKTVQQIEEGKYRVPSLKKLESANKGNEVVNNAVPAGFTETEGDMPF